MVASLISILGLRQHALQLRLYFVKFVVESPSTAQRSSQVMSSEVPAYITYLMTAVAVSIIRASPVGMSGRQYAEKLYVRYQLKLNGQRVKLDRLQNKLYMSVVHKDLQDVFDSHGFSTYVQSNAISPENNDILPTFECAFPYAPFLREAISVSGEQIRRCHSVGSLNLTVESIVHSLFETLTDSMTSMHSSASTLSLHTAEMISKLLKSSNAEFIVLPQSVDGFLYLSVRELLLHLVRSTSIWNSKQKSVVLDVLRKLCDDRSVRHCIMAVADDLLTDCLVKLQLPVNHDDEGMEACEIENVAILLNIFEHLVSYNGEYRNREGCSFHTHVEHCIRLSSVYPLLSLYMWHISKRV